MSTQPPPAPTASAVGPCPTVIQIVGRPGTGFWLVGCLGFNGPLRQFFSLYRAVSQREGERRERIDESKNVQTTPTRTYCKCNRPLPYYNPNCRTPRHWKFTQHHRTTQPPHPGTGSLPSTIATPNHPSAPLSFIGDLSSTIFDTATQVECLDRSRRRYWQNPNPAF